MGRGVAIEPGGAAVASEAVLRVFGKGRPDVSPREVKDLLRDLEKVLGDRSAWTMEVARTLFDALVSSPATRKRTADHERQFWLLAGYCLRPGLGAALDDWRIDQLWALFAQGIQYVQESNNWSEWWTLWRRVVGGLPEQAQDQLLQDFAFNLRGAEAGLQERPRHLVRGHRDEMLRLGASLERVAAEHKAEVGDWLVQGLRARAGRAATADPWVLWAIGRLGARVPLYGSALPAPGDPGFRVLRERWVTRVQGDEGTLAPF